MEYSFSEIIENRIHPKMRLNGICPYFTMFPLSFPFSILSKANKNDIVFDPFCGRGTTNYAARLLGLESYGVDCNPVAYAIANAKIIDARPKDIIELLTNIISNKTTDNIPNDLFWNLAYHKKTLMEISTIRAYFLSKKRLNKTDIALQGIMLGVLHGPIMKTQFSYLSNQMPRTFSTKPKYSVSYWKKHSLSPSYVSTLELVSRKALYLFNKDLPKSTVSRIILGDSRVISRKIKTKIDWVVTSPPYFGMSTYEQDQWLRKWFLGGPEKVDYSHNSQLKHWSEDAFISDLADVWKETAKNCNSQCNLIIRFGALPSRSERTPSEIIKDSIYLSQSGWKIKTIRKAGIPHESKRQANQFHNSTGKYIEEVDVYATLET